MKQIEVEVFRNTPEHHVLWLLASEGAMTTEQLAARVRPGRNGSSRAFLADTKLRPMEAGGLLKRQNNTWSLTTAGLDRKLSLGDYMSSHMRIRTPDTRVQDWRTRELYDGAELRSRVHRAGAYDAYAMPSIRGSSRVYPDGRREPI